MDKEIDFSCLPREMMSKIFGYLSYCDFTSVLVVSRLWKDVGEDPLLWKDFPLIVNSSERFSDMVKMQRFARVRTIKISAGSVTTKEEAEEFLSIIANHRSIKELNLCYNDVKSVCPSMLATCFNSLQKVRDVELSDSQVLELFKTMRVKTDLKELEISSANFENVPEEVFSQAINKLERLNLKFSTLTPQQVETMFKAIADDTKVNNIAIVGTENIHEGPLDANAAAPVNKEAKLIWILN